MSGFAPIRLFSHQFNNMTQNELSTEEQKFIDRWVEVANGASWRNAKEEAAFKEFIYRLNAESDLWNSSWPGFHEKLTIGPFAYIEEALESAFEQGGIPGDDDYSADEAISGFREVLDGVSACEGHPPEAWIQLKASTGEIGWLVFSLGDWGELEEITLAHSPKSFVANCRSTGCLVLGGDLPSLPGYDDEILTDKEILAYIEHATPRKRQEDAERQRRLIEEEEKRRLKREASRAQGSGKQKFPMSDQQSVKD